MGDKLAVTEKAGVFYVTGTIDASAELAPLLASGRSSLAIDFSGVRGINSIGARRLAQFVLDARGKTLEFHACPVELIEVFNVLPELVMEGGAAARLESFQFPHTCTACAKAATPLFTMAEVKRSGGALTVPLRTCDACKAPLEPELPAEDYLMFLDLKE